MKKFKILISKHFEILSITETEDTMPEGENLYYDMGSDMRVPDFVLIRSASMEQAREEGDHFIDQWRTRLEGKG